QDTVTDLALEDGSRLGTTEDHPFWSVTDARFERADELTPGEQVLTADGQTIRVDGLRDTASRTALAYNLSVDGIHTYHVGAGAILDHNTCPIGDVLAETVGHSGKPNLTSTHNLSQDEALNAGIRRLGDGYSEIGKPGSGVFRSGDGLRQFRMDSGSITGGHAPQPGHVHFEIYGPGGRTPIVNNHVPLDFGR
ncbi:MAG: polymorphic toxin-type HINT domain-containing protein, partial [Candidatus Binatia bacterium]